jgi:hypothetical protein
LEHVGAGRSRVGRAPHDHWLACRCAQPWPTSPNLRKVCAVPRCTAIVVGERSEHWHPGPAPPVSTWPAASGPPGAEAAGIELAPPPPAVPSRGCQRQLASGPAGTASGAGGPAGSRLPPWRPGPGALPAAGSSPAALYTARPGPSQGPSYSGQYSPGVLSGLWETRSPGPTPA